MSLHLLKNEGSEAAHALNPIIFSNKTNHNGGVGIESALHQRFMLPLRRIYLVMKHKYLLWFGKGVRDHANAEVSTDLHSTVERCKQLIRAVNHGQWVLTNFPGLAYGLDHETTSLLQEAENDRSPDRTQRPSFGRNLLFSMIN